MISRSCDEDVHRRLVAHVGDVEPDAILEAVDVEPVAAVVGIERVDDQHVGAGVDELPHEIAADEAEPAGDHDAAIAIEREISGFHVCWAGLTPTCRKAGRGMDRRCMLSAGLRHGKRPIVGGLEASGDEFPSESRHHRRACGLSEPDAQFGIARERENRIRQRRRIALRHDDAGVPVLARPTRCRRPAS